MAKWAPAVLAAVALLSSVVSFVQAQGASAQQGEPFELGLGQKAVVESENIVVRFAGVVQDSRCPSDVLCIWQGQATINVSVQVDGSDLQELMLTIGADASRSAAFGQYSVKLLSLQPYPQSNVQIDEEDYVATLVVSKESLNSKRVLIRAASDDVAVVAGWNIEENRGTLVRLAKSDDGVERDVYRFMLWADECSEQQGRECVEGRILQEAEVRFGTSFVRAEVVGDELLLSIGGGISVTYILDIKEIRTFE